MSEQVRNRREDFKHRWHDLVLRSTGDKQLATKIYREMVNQEMDERIDAQSRK